MKSGIDYFPLDVSLDSKMELIEAEFGLTGFGVVVKLLAEIYGKQGYYIEWTEEVALLFARKVGLGGGVVSEIVKASVKRGMFDKSIFNKYRVLTSRGIQKRYFEAVSRRKEIEVDDNILLVNPTLFCKNVNIIRKNVYISNENADISEQRKEEKSREEESKEEETTSGLETSSSSAVDFFLNRINPAPSMTCLEELREYEADLGAAVCIRAIMVALDEKKSNWAYIRGILRNKQRAGIRSLEAWDAYEAQRSQKKNGCSIQKQEGGTPSGGQSVSERYGVKPDIIL